MIIETVKWSNNDKTQVLVNGAHYVPLEGGTWLSALVSEWLDAGNTPEPFQTIDELKTLRKEEIKAEAGRRIVETIPEWKQRNMIADALFHLAELVQAIPNAPAEPAEAVALREAWAEVVAVRSASDVAEAAVDLAQTLEEVDQIKL